MGLGPAISCLLLAVSAGRGEKEPGHRAVLTPPLGEPGSGPHKAGPAVRAAALEGGHLPPLLSSGAPTETVGGRAREKGGDTSRLRGAHMFVGTQMQTNMKWVSWGDRWWDRLREVVTFEQGP